MKVVPASSSRLVGCLLGVVVVGVCRILYTTTTASTKPALPPLTHSQNHGDGSRSKNGQEEAFIFSGVYHPRIGGSWETYSGAFLISRTRLLLPLTQHKIKNIVSLEDTVSAVGGNQYDLDSHHRITIMTLDYMDFHVRHLSSTSNNAIPYGDNYELNTIIINQMKATNIEYRLAALKRHRHTQSSSSGKMKKKICNEYYTYDDFNFGQIIHTNRTTKSRSNSINDKYHDKRLLNHTIAIIPFSTRAASLDNDGNIFQWKIRILYFISTFWSIFYNIPHIVVTAATKNDYDILQKIVGIYKNKKNGDIYDCNMMDTYMQKMLSNKM